jgi:large subunit ribosomal protein L29
VRARELRTLTREELTQRLREAREELFNLKFQHKTGQLGNPLRIREVRKDIARLITVLEEGGVAGAPAAKGEADTEPARRE